VIFDQTKHSRRFIKLRLNH